VSIEKVQLAGGILPSKNSLLQSKLAQMFLDHINIGQAYFEGFVPNANQQRVRQVIDTSTVPKGQWLHILLYGEPRSGKTWAALYYVIDIMLRFPGARSLGVRSTTSELNTSVFLDVDKFADKWGIPIIRRSTQEGLVELANHSQMWWKSDKSLTPGARDNTARKMGGMEYSLALVEEADTVSSETARAIPHRLSQNVGDFRKVIFYTQNPPDRDHWTYEFFFKSFGCDPDDPASPIRAIHCPLEGNIENIGVGYKEGLAKEYDDDPAMKKRFVLGQFAPSIKGDPIFKKAFNRDFHVAKETFVTNWNRSLPMWRGWDFGFRGNSCVIMQDDTDRHQLRVFYAFLERKILYEQFLDLILAQCYRLFPGAEWRDYPDPHGDQKTALSEYSYHEIMKSRGLDPIFDRGRKSVVKGVNLISKELRAQGKAGQPAFLIDPTAVTLIDAFESGYCNSKGALKDELRPVEDNTYIHTMDACRYPIVMNRDFYGEDAVVQPFQVIQDGDKIRDHVAYMNAHDATQYRGPARQGGRDGSFSRSRFSR
jgi:hypothetical protein